MGNFLARRMDLGEDDETLVVGNSSVSVGDSDIAQLLQYLIRSGQVHIIASDRDDSSEEENMLIAAPFSLPRTVPNPNTESLDKSAFKHYTCSGAGFVQKTGQKRPKSITNNIRSREHGLPGSGSFTAGDKCRIQNHFIPNKGEQIEDYHSKIFCCGFSKNGHNLLTASQDKKIRLYDSRGSNLRLLKTFNGRSVGWSILDTAFSPDGQFIAYSSWSESIHLCRIFEDPDQHETLLICPYDRRFCIFSLTFSSAGNEILCGANDGCIYIHDIERFERVSRIPSHDDDVNTVAFADDSSQIVYSGGDDGVVKVWDRRTLFDADPQPVGMLGGHMDGITFIEPRGDGRHLLSNSKDQSIKLWDVRLFSSDDTVTRTKKSVNDQSWDYRWQAIPKQLKNPRKRVNGDTSIMTYCGHSVLQTLCRCHFSPASVTGQRYIYTGCASGRIVVYDALTGKIVRELQGHRGTVRDAAWHPHRQEIISSSWDGFLYRWMYSSRDCNIDELEEESSNSDHPRRSQRIRDRMNRIRAKYLAASDHEVDA